MKSGAGEEVTWDCRDGTPDEDHDWKYVGADPEVGICEALECRVCGKVKDYDGRFDCEEYPCE